MTLELLQAQAQNCTACRLMEGRTRVVFGEGNPDAKLMIVGEGPGEEEVEGVAPGVELAGDDEVVEDEGEAEGEGREGGELLREAPKPRGHELHPVPKEPRRPEVLLQLRLDLEGPWGLGLEVDVDPIAASIL